jgi:hypothetical protein
MWNALLLSLLRQALMAAGAVVVSKGWLDGDALVQVVGAIIAAVSSGLSLINAKSAAEAKSVVKTLGVNDPHRVL